MKVKDLLEALSKVDPETYVCGYGSYELLGVLNEISALRSADTWHDALPEGERYITLYFNEDRKTPPPVPDTYVCTYCGNRVKSLVPVSCKKCSWFPMMKKEIENASSCNETKAGSGEAYDPDQAVS